MAKIQKNKMGELLSTAKTAAFTADLANSNIEKYILMHNSKNIKNQNSEGEVFVMKISDETEQTVNRLVREFAELAAANLQDFIKMQKGSK